MRLFSAIAVPDDVAECLALHRGGLPDAKWVDPADYHVTLAFLGELDGAIAEELAGELAEIGSNPVALTTTGLGVFGSDRPHAIVAFVEKSAGLLALEAAHRSACSRLGVALETRKFTPHVTLAWLRRTGAAEVAAWMTGQPAFRPGSWLADRFAIYSSRTSRGGGPYVAEVEFSLRSLQSSVRLPPE